jgi:tetratricopeptide (TPR) repeat protein
MAVAGLAVARAHGGDLPAMADLEQALAHAQAIHDDYAAGIFSQMLGELLTQLGQWARAEGLLTAALDYYRQTDMCPYLARGLRSLAQLYAKAGRMLEAERAQAEAEALQSQRGLVDIRVQNTSVDRAHHAALTGINKRS